MSVEVSKPGDRKSEEKTKFLFADGETVLCYHGPLLYEAKCIKAELKNKAPQYLIHYSGWNKSWDEWVSCPRVCKYSEENLKKQQELLKSHGTSKIITKIKANARKSVSSNSMGDPEKMLLDIKKKRTKTQEESSELSDSYTIKNEIKITITDELKKILASEFHAISTLSKLVNLPASYTVDSFLADYVEYKLDQQFDKDVIIEATEGIKLYFNSTLQTKLMINDAERQQYIDLVKASGKKPSEVYGMEHLLRLFVVIGDLLSFTYWDEICIKQLDLYLEDVIKFMNQKCDTLFVLDNHIDAPSEKKL